MKMLRFLFVGLSLYNFRQYYFHFKTKYASDSTQRITVWDYTLGVQSESYDHVRSYWCFQQTGGNGSCVD